ncbi:YtfJ family protein [Pantoea sp. LMR881]|uniref:YtfJ family protein n=1 Tax=Pantoea sp. LMR881 TaxID=3014336 RepID=UPI0022AE53E3|nr:YtfJ family protein [Pantoea sp. LMR881]MCZ4057849.1 YtfJ family protein [Pantoea sp. LMR881]
MLRFGLITLTLFSPFVGAHNFVTGQPVPSVFIADKGEMVMEKGELDYQKWSSRALTGKVRVLIHVAGRLSAKDQTAGLINAIQQAALPQNAFQTTTIVNTDDALPGSGIFVVHSIESSKKSAPWQQFIIDDSGVAQHVWQLKPEGSTVVVIDQQGVVRFAKDGALTSQEVTQVMAELRAMLG